MEHLSELKKKMKKNKCILLLVFVITVSVQTNAQNQQQHFSVLFYNVENLFDCEDDTETLDEEFTPGGERHWTYNRLNEKLLNISKVVLNASGWEPPQLVALCEVENRYVLDQLTGKTPMQNFPYKIIHKESPDDRGIDVALLYNDDFFYPLTYRYFPLKSRNDSVIETREILYISGIAGGTDTLHFFINHWPSRYGGLLETQGLRNLAARSLRKHYNRLKMEYHQPKVILLGDFNDQPQDESIKRYLVTLDVRDEFCGEDIINLSARWTEGDLGTIKYRSQWSVFDQVMVSGSLLKCESGYITEPEMAKIVKLPFLLEKDERYGGLKTNRTYNGYRYNGGFSDHLPVLLKLETVH